MGARGPGRPSWGAIVLWLPTGDPGQPTRGRGSRRAPSRPLVEATQPLPREGTVNLRSPRRTDRRSCLIGAPLRAVLVLLATFAPCREGSATAPSLVDVAALQSAASRCCPYAAWHQSDRETDVRRVECSSAVASRRGAYAFAMHDVLNFHRILDAFHDADEAELIRASCVVSLLVTADVSRDRIHALLNDVLALQSRESWEPYAATPTVPPINMSQPSRTEAESEKIAFRVRQVLLLEDFAVRTIGSFRAARDCRLADDLVAMVGNSVAVDDAALRYLNAACANDSRLASRAYEAVAAIPWKTRQLYSLWRSARQLMSASTHPGGYLSPSDRIRRLWYAPMSELDRVGVGREMVDDERRQLDVVMRFPRAHVAAMARLFEAMSLDARSGTEQEEILSARVHGMLEIIEQLPLSETRELLAQWYVRIEAEAPVGGYLSRQKFAVLSRLGTDCVPKLATWMIASLRNTSKDSMRRVLGAGLRDERAAYRASAVVQYIASCQSTMPELRAQLSQLATEHSGTVIQASIDRALEPDRTEPRP